MSPILGSIVKTAISMVESALLEVAVKEAEAGLNWLETEVATIRKGLGIKQDDAQAEQVKNVLDSIE